MYDLERSNLARYFSQQNVFLTGATGTLGRMVLYKLLKCGPHRVYVLVRAKHKKTAQERLEELLRSGLYDNLPRRVFERVTLIEGDITKPLMDISAKEIIILRSDITVALHLAAAPREFLSPAIQIQHNVFGLEQFLRVCEGMVHARTVLIHSTAFAHADRAVIEERLYPTLTGVVEMGRQAVQDPMDFDTRLASCGVPFFTAFTFSKFLAEHLLVDVQLPIVLLRTTHFGNAAHDPYPGWFHNSGPIQDTVKAIGSGLVSAMTCSTGNALSMMPVDLVANAVLLSTWRRSSIPDYGCRVCHCAPPPDSIMAWGSFVRMVLEISHRQREPRSTRTPWLVLTPFPFVTLLMTIFIDTVYALYRDVVGLFDLRLPSNFRQVFSNYQTLKEITRESSVSSKILTRNLDYLVANLSEADQVLFDTRLSKVPWTAYVDLIVCFCQPSTK